MTRSLRPAGAALVAVLALLGTLLVSEGTAYAAGPVVTITSPTAPFSGQLTLAADITTDPGDTYVSVTVDLDGTVLTATDTCTVDTDAPCSVTVDHDFTQQPGAHTLTVTVFTLLTPAGGSDQLTFTVENPLPFVSIANPGLVKGLVNLSVAANTNTGNLTDYPASIGVVVDAGTPNAQTLPSVPCTGVGVRPCSGTTPWESSGLTGSHSITATVTTTNGVTNTAVRVVTVSSPAPTVAISDPANGDTRSGTIVVTSDAHTDVDLTEVPTQIQLLADGGVVDTQPCVLATHDCSLTLTWDATGLTGDHVLTTVVSTSLLRTATSSAVTVAVTTPPFDVAITSPAASAVVVGAGATTTSSGIVPVAVTASTDLTQNEYPALLELLVDGLVVDQFICAGSPVHACAATLDWDARTSAGLHKLAARVTTTRNHEATSASRSVFARSGSRVAFVATPIDAYGGYITLRGVVTSTTSKQPLVGAAVRLVLVPAIGTARTLVVRTGVGGVFTLRTRYYSNTVVSARVGASWLVKGTALVTQLVRAPISCSTAGTSFVRGTVGRGVCVVRNLPAGTVVRLRYNYRGRWFALATGRTTSTVVRFTFRFLPRGTYSLQVTVGASRPYVATASRLMKIVIR